MSSWRTKFSALHKRRPGKRQLISLLVLALLAGGGLVYYQRNSAPPTAEGKPGMRTGRPMPVLAEPATSGELKRYLNALGTVVPRNTVTVKARVDGQLMRLLFREGQTVKAGELLAEIDPRPFQVQVTQAEGQYAKDQALVTNAKLDLERYRSLYAQQAASKQQLDTQEALLRQYEGALKVDQGQLDNARLQLSYTRITAPVAGRVGLRQVDPGNLIRSSDTLGLVVITQEKPITAIFSLAEDHVSPVMQGLQGKQPLRVDAYDREQKHRLASGTLLTADNQIDTSTGTVRLKAQFANDDGTLFPNQFVNIKLLLETRNDATLISSAAVQRGAQGTFVYVVKDDQTVTIRPVKLGPADGERIAIDSGIAPGELIVVDGADKLREGSKVDLTSRDKAANAAKAAMAEGGKRRKEGAGAGSGQGGGKRPRSAE
jgi:multidrug efflux system membrane fusion protein